MSWTLFWFLFFIVAGLFLYVITSLHMLMKDVAKLNLKVNDAIYTHEAEMGEIRGSIKSRVKKEEE